MQTYPQTTSVVRGEQSVRDVCLCVRTVGITIEINDSFGKQISGKLVHLDYQEFKGHGHRKGQFIVTSVELK